MKPSHDDLEDARQRCQEHYESCDCQHAQIAKEIEPLLTGPIRQILHVLSRCDRAAVPIIGRALCIKEWIGDLDSNQDSMDQNHPCSLLHHLRMISSFMSWRTRWESNPRMDRVAAGRLPTWLQVLTWPAGEDSNLHRSD